MLDGQRVGCGEWAPVGHHIGQHLGGIGLCAEVLPIFVIISSHKANPNHLALFPGAKVVGIAKAPLVPECRALLAEVVVVVAGGQLIATLGPLHLGQIAAPNARGLNTSLFALFLATKPILQWFCVQLQITVSSKQNKMQTSFPPHPPYQNCEHRLSCMSKNLQIKSAVGTFS